MLNMYSMQHLEVPSAKATMERMYSTRNTLGTEDSMPHTQNPRKGNMFQSMLNALNVIWDHFSRVPTNFMANINNPLSVTVVQNEGIISHEFFKSLTTRKEPLTTDNIYIHNVPKKDSLNIVEKVHCSLFDEENTGHNDNADKSMNKSYAYDTVHSDMKDYEIIGRFEKLELSDGIDTVDYIMDYNELHSGRRTQFNSLIPYCNPEYETENLLNKITGHTENAPDGRKDMILEEKKTENINGDKLNTDARSPTSSLLDISEENLTIVPQTMISHLFTHMWRKVFGKVGNQIYFRANTMESDTITKRALSPKQQRKITNVTKGRGRGRAKPQLRRSGVSQTRHRKERSKHDLVIDIQDDFRNWQEFEIYHRMEDDSIDWLSFDESDEDVMEDSDLFIEELRTPLTSTFNDIPSRCQRPKTRKVIDQEASKFSARVRYVPDSGCDMNTIREEYNEEKREPQIDAFRSRLFSESSVDSEDSYCIVFETGSDLNCRNEIDEESGNEFDSSDEDQEEEEEEEGEDESEDESNIEASASKVRFNLTPKVHIMVQWDYAYRAARRGPWEEMARDRERFKGRINSIDRVLRPILSTQHRTRIWQERFAT